jgi:hypothetical protein
VSPASRLARTQRQRRPTHNRAGASRIADCEREASLEFSGTPCFYYSKQDHGKLVQKPQVTLGTMVGYSNWVVQGAVRLDNLVVMKPTPDVGFEY